MPTYLYSCENPECIGEFEEYHSIVIKLEECPYCLLDGRGSQPIERLINGGGSGRGIVTQTMEEIKANMPNEVKKIYDRASKSEAFTENFLGSSKYKGY